MIIMFGVVFPEVVIGLKCCIESTIEGELDVVGCLDLFAAIEDAYMKFQVVEARTHVQFTVWHEKRKGDALVVGCRSLVGRARDLSIACIVLSVVVVEPSAVVKVEPGNSTETMSA